MIAAGLDYTVETEYKAEYVIPEADAVSLPANGFKAAATDKVINPYVKQVGSTAQDRAVFDIVFGAAGTKDNDAAISKIGYILFYGEGSGNYIDTADSKVTDAKLKEIVASAAMVLKTLPMQANTPAAASAELPSIPQCRILPVQTK